MKTALKISQFSVVVIEMQQVHPPSCNYYHSVELGVIFMGSCGGYLAPIYKYTSILVPFCLLLYVLRNFDG